MTPVDLRQLDRTPSTRRARRRTAGVCGLVLATALVLGGCAFPAASGAISPATAVPALDSGSPSARSGSTPTKTEAVVKTETVVLAGGCFWGVQGVFQHVKGVTMAESGYSGGAADTATYDEVSTGTTGHAESVRVTFDPTQVTYAQLLQIFFSVVQDPTQLNRQGPDTGTQYRSEIFAQDAGQQRVAAAYIAQLERKVVYPAPIVTTVEVDTSFYPAEKHHQDFLELNPDYPYIVANDLPKVRELQRLFPALYRSDPVLVFAADK